MTIKTIYTVNGIDYTDRKAAKAASCRGTIEGLYGKEVADKMFADKELIGMLYAIKVANKKPKAEVGIDEVKALKAKKVKKVA